MRRENATLAYALHCFTKSDAIVFDYLARQFQGQEGGMPLIEMKDCRLNIKYLQQTHTANAQHHLLDQTRLAIAAIEMARHQPIDFTVLRNVRIEQVELHPSHGRTPHA